MLDYKKLVHFKYYYLIYLVPVSHTNIYLSTLNWVQNFIYPDLMFLLCTYCGLWACRKADTGSTSETDGKSETAPQTSSPRLSTSSGKPQIWVILEGLQLILSSTYLLQVALFLWLSALVSSFFYFQVRKYFLIWDINCLLQSCFENCIYYSWASYRVILDHMLLN